jgi:hypothetical protein
MNKKEFQKLTRKGYIVTSWKKEEQREDIIDEVVKFGYKFYESIGSYRNSRDEIEVESGLFIVIPKESEKAFRAVLDSWIIREQGEQESVFLYFDNIATLEFTDVKKRGIRSFFHKFTYGNKALQSDNFTIVPELGAIFSWS